MCACVRACVFVCSCSWSHYGRCATTTPTFSCCVSPWSACRRSTPWQPVGCPRSAVSVRGRRFYSSALSATVARPRRALRRPRSWRTSGPRRWLTGSVPSPTCPARRRCRSESRTSSTPRSPSLCAVADCCRPAQAWAVAACGRHTGAGGPWATYWDATPTVHCSRTTVVSSRRLLLLGRTANSAGNDYCAASPATSAQIHAIKLYDVMEWMHCSVYAA